MPAVEAAAPGKALAERAPAVVGPALSALYGHLGSSTVGEHTDNNVAN